MNRMTEVFYNTMDEVLNEDEKAIVLLGVSGVGIAIDLSKKYPGRFVDAGIMEQAIVGMASGMSIAGMHPIIYGQSTFFIERAFEQLKIDFAYQKVGGNIVVYGNATEFGVLGATHCCPGALGELTMIPDIEIIDTGRPEEFYDLFKQTYADGKPTIFRTSLFTNSYKANVFFGKANVVKTGTKATIIAIGPMLELALRTFENEDVTVLYYTTVAPFDEMTLQENLHNDRILLMEPGYQGGIAHTVMKALKGERVKIDFVGYPLEFITNHGYVVDNAPMYKLTSDAVIEKYHSLLA